MIYVGNYEGAKFQIIRKTMKHGFQIKVIGGKLCPQEFNTETEAFKQACKWYGYPDNWKKFSR